MKLIRIYYLVFAYLGAVPSLAGISYTWTGNGNDSNWSNATNWSPSGVPGVDPTDNVTLVMVTKSSPKLDQNRTLANLTITDQILDLNGFTLIVNGPATALNSGLVKNGSLEGYPSETWSPGMMLAASNVSMLTLNTSQIATNFAYTLIGAGFTGAAANGGPVDGILSVFPVLGSGNVLLDMVIKDPSNALLSQTIQLTIDNLNRITAVTVVGGASNYALPAGYYSLYNSNSYITFSANLLSLLFKNCQAAFSDNQNFVRTQYLQTPCTDPALINNLPVESAVQTTSYLDGLGRPFQIVNKQVSPLKKDLVQVVEYDLEGNTPRQYLPYASDLCNGALIDATLAKSQQQNFYTVNSDPLIPKVIDPALYNGTQNNAYTEIIYEHSPLNRVMEIASPGDAWKVSGTTLAGTVPAITISNGTGKTKQFIYRGNFSTEVLKWSYLHVNGSASCAVSNIAQYYDEATLYVQESKDEDGLKSLEFTDKAGQVVLKRKIVNANTNQDSYYVYDDFGHLVYIITPQAVSLLASQNYMVTATGDFTLQWLFMYQYDGRHRLKSKKVPGSVATTILYDPLDRPVMSQTGNQALINQWSFVKYDVMGRAILNGLFTDNLAVPVATIQNALNSTTYLFEKRSSASGNLEGYTNQTIPGNQTSSNLLAVNYYDNYDFNNDGTADYTYTNASLGTSEPLPTNNVTLLPTGTKTRSLDGVSNPWLWTVGFYDKYNQVVQTQSNNHLYLAQYPAYSATLPDITTVVYDFAGKVLSTKKVHVPGVASPVTVKKQFTYDHVGRSLKVFQQNNTDLAVTLAAYRYNEIGQLVEKNLHSENNGVTYLQSVDYRTNIRGLLTSINNSDLSKDILTNDDANDLFGMNLVYEGNFSGLNTPRYNGNITAVRWRTNNTNLSNNPINTAKGYTYQYDNLNQLISANYAENTGNGWLTSAKYSETGISYDLNGNIKTLNRTDGIGSFIDKLQYTYTGTGNQLVSMLDLGDKNAGFVNKSVASIQYGYDKNGNLLTDANREVNLAYNYLNLITKVTGTGSKAGKIIDYVYSGQGVKLKKTVTSSGTVVAVTHYVDEFVYEYSNNTYKLLFFATEQGRAIAKTSGGFADYQYTLTDHLGSARITFDKGADGKATVVQEDHYYAFGMRLGGLSYVKQAPKNNFLFGSNEAEDDQNLLNQYDFGFRQYDPTLGRWHSQDMLADLYHSFSPYHYALNNPVNLMDILGLGVEVEDMAMQPYEGNGGGGKEKDDNDEGKKYKAKEQRIFNQGTPKKKTGNQVEYSTQMSSDNTTGVGVSGTTTQGASTASNSYSTKSENGGGLKFSMALLNKTSSEVYNNSVKSITAYLTSFNTFMLNNRLGKWGDNLLPAIQTYSQGVETTENNKDRRATGRYLKIVNKADMDALGIIGVRDGFKERTNAAAIRSLGDAGEKLVDVAGATTGIQGDYKDSKGGSWLYDTATVRSEYSDSEGLILIKVVTNKWFGTTDTIREK